MLYKIIYRIRVGSDREIKRMDRFRSDHHDIMQAIIAFSEGYTTLELISIERYNPPF